MRSLALLLLLHVTGPVLWAQGDGLDGEFSKLSARERSRIAKEEAREAGSDALFQAVMNEGEELFRSQRYEEALERFVQARDLRPYNVYPRVKIQDLQALIARRDAATVQEQTPASLEPQPDPTAAALPRPASPGPGPVAVSDTVPDAPPLRSPETPEPPATRPTERPADRPVVEQRVAPPTPRPVPEEGERIYKEGRAVVTERTVAMEGRPVVFRKVLHPWGETMYFRDGLAIPERVWTETFGQR